MKKSVLTSMLLASAGLMLFSGCGDKKETTTAATKEEGKVLNICVWNEEFQDRFKTYFEAKGLLPAGVTVNWILTPNQDNAYQNRLDTLLLEQESKPADEKVDLFLVEADYALKYVGTDYTLDVMNDIGLTEADVAGQYQYTKDIMTQNKDGKKILKGVSWQACPGGLIYRRSIAKDVLGTDDPAEVQAKLNNWDMFNAVAADAKAKGYYMVSGYDDTFRIFSDNIKKPFVNGNKIQIDDSIKAWIKQTKEFTDNGYNNKANMWSAESWKGASKEGKVFGYFGPAWFIDFCLAPATLDDAKAPKEIGNGSYGDWAFCKGPQGFSWGGSWLCAAAGTDNKKLIKEIMYKLTCDKATMIEIAEQKGDFTNNEEAMAEVAKGSYKNDFLGGQNHIALLLDSAKSIDKSNIGPYDQGFVEKLQGSFADYYNGLVSEDVAWENFYKSIKEKYPNLEK